MYNIISHPVPALHRKLRPIEQEGQFVYMLSKYFRHKIFAHNTAMWPTTVFDVQRKKAQNSFMWQKVFGNECQSLVAEKTL